MSAILVHAYVLGLASGFVIGVAIAMKSRGPRPPRQWGDAGEFEQSWLDHVENTPFDPLNSRSHLDPCQANTPSPALHHAVPLL